MDGTGGQIDGQVEQHVEPEVQQQLQQLTKFDDEITALLFKAGMYINEMTSLVAQNPDRLKDKTIFGADGLISEDGKGIIGNAKEPKDEEEKMKETSYDRFLLKLKNCLMNLGELENLSKNKQSDKLELYLINMKETLKKLKMDKEEEFNNMNIVKCEGTKTREQCQADLDKAKEDLEVFRKAIEDALKTQQTDIEGMGKKGEKVMELQKMIEDGKKEFTDNADNITDAQVKAIMEKVDAISGEGDSIDADDIANLKSNLNQLLEDIKKKEEQKRTMDALEGKVSDLEAQQAALTQQALQEENDARLAEAQGEKEEEQGAGVVEGTNVPVEEPLVVPPVNEGEENGADESKDAENPVENTVVGESGDGQVGSEEGTNLPVKAVAVQNDDTTGVDEGGKEEESGDDQTVLSENAPVVASGETTGDTEGTHETTGKNQGGENEGGQDGNILSLKKHTEGLDNAGKSVQNEPDLEEQAFQQELAMAGNQGDEETAVKKAAREIDEKVREGGLAVPSPEDGQKPEDGKDCLTPPCPSSSGVILPKPPGDGQKVSEPVKAGDTVETVPPLEGSKENPITAQTTKEEEMLNKVGCRKIKQQKKKKRKSKKKRIRKSKNKIKKKSRRKSKKKRN